MEKITLITLFIFRYLLCFSQEKLSTSNKSDTLKHSQLSNESYYRKIKNYQEFDFYQDKDGFVYRKGMSLKIGKPENPNSKTEVLWGPPRSGGFTFIRPYKGLIEKLDKKFSNEELTITGFSAIHSGAFKGTPLESIVNCKLKNKVGLQEEVFIDNIDKAIELGEIINDNKKPSKERAIALLEEKKKLLDLGLITKDEYEKIKSEYSDIILKE